MTAIVIITVLVLLVCFAGVLLVGAPYLPTLNPQVATAFELLEAKKYSTMLELGSGDGKVLVAAAERKIHITGYELNPFLFVIAWLRTRKHKQFVTLVYGNFWHKRWPQTDAIYTFLLPRYMSKLDQKIRRYKHRPIKLVSIAFEVPDRKPDHRRNGVFMYVYQRQHSQD